MAYVTELRLFLAVDDGQPIVLLARLHTFTYDRVEVRLPNLILNLPDNIRGSYQLVPQDIITSNIRRAQGILLAGGHEAVVDMNHILLS